LNVFLCFPLQQGVRFDPDLPQTIRLEFAKSNTKVSKPKQQQQQQNNLNSMANASSAAAAAAMSAAAAVSQQPLVHPLTGRKYGMKTMRMHNWHQHN
jgi:hypothetical protein